MLSFLLFKKMVRREKLMAMGALCFVIVSAVFAEEPKRMPIVPIQASVQKPSAEMKAVILDLEKRLSKLDQSERLTSLPNWVFDPKQAEFYYIIPSPIRTDSFRYSVILGSGQKVIVVRAGGLSDVYDYFDITPQA